MSRSVHRVAWFVTVALCGGCAAGSPHPPLPPNVSFSDVQEQRFVSNKPVLYVAGAKLSEYSLGASKPLRSVTQGPYVSNAVLALDGNGDLVEANGNPSFQQILVFDAHTLKLKGTYDGAGWLYSMVASRAGYLYCAAGGPIYVFDPKAMRTLGAINRGGDSNGPLIFDRSGYLYAGDRRQVRIFAPMPGQWQMRYIRSVRDGVNTPEALAIGPSGNLYVSNWPVGNHGWVNVYASNGSHPIRRMGIGIRGPMALAVDSQEQLYVGNVPLRGARSQWRGWISVYPSGAVQPSRRITDGVYTPQYLQLSPSGDLYVGNVYAGVSKGRTTVTVYNSGGSRLLRTITKGIIGVPALLIGTP